MPLEGIEALNLLNSSSIWPKKGPGVRGGKGKNFYWIWMFFKTKKFIQNLKDSCGPRRVRGNFSQGGKTSRTLEMMKLTL